jgi:hypothetical protein
MAERDALEARLEQVARSLGDAELKLDQTNQELEQAQRVRDVARQRWEGAHADDFVWLLGRKPSADGFPVMRSSTADAPDDHRLVGRIVAAYQRAHAQYSKTPSSWDLGLWEIKRDIHERLLRGSVEQVAAMLRNPASTTLFWGFDALAKAPPRAVEPHELVLKRLNDRTDWTHLYAIWIMDALRGLAESVGAIRVNYPEVERETEIVSDELKSADPIIDVIEARMGKHLDFPNPFPGELGLSSRRGVISFRAVQAIYQAWRIAELISKNAGRRVLEIGGGLGRTAYYAVKFGIQDYTIVDIPLTNVAQGYFLGRIFGPDGVRLFGEEGDGIRIIPPAAFLSVHDRYDLIVNVDSLTELDRATAETYCTAAKKRAVLFLSINHEFNPLTAQKVCTAANMIQEYRMPYWMRRGYVEELFRM